MKHNKKKWIIIVDSFTALGFFIAFKLSWTGLRLHELLGLMVGVLTILHLGQHWKWVDSISKKFFDAPAKIKIRYLIDAGLFYGFMVKIGTGIIISSLLNLYLSNYEMWRFIHVSVSYALLVLIGLKLALHWKWIVNTARCLVRKPITKTSRIECITTEDSIAAAKRINRQEALKTMGVFGAFLVISAVGYEKWLRETQTFSNPVTSNTQPAIAPTVESTQTSTPFSPEATSQPVNSVNTTPISTATPAATNTPTMPPTATPEISTGTVRCTRGCSYPGRCRRYTDSNNNNICDLSEW
jgi:hypothetical protein